MNRSYYQEFFRVCSYPEEEIQSLNEGFDKISCMGAEEDFDALVKRYAADINAEFALLCADMERIAERVGVHPYQGILLLFIAMTEPLKDFYRIKGVEESVWLESVLDLRYKALECKETYNVWGTFVANWYQAFFQMRRFAFGKLQFEVIDFGEDFQLEALSLRPNSKVINVHIPRTGSPLDRDSATESYQQAKEFFKEVRYGEATVFVCHSWLLFSKNKQILNPQSNLAHFIDTFTIVKEVEYPNYEQTWRLFSTNDLSDLDALPKKTSLQRAYVEMMKRGEKTGWATGVFLF